MGWFYLFLARLLTGERLRKATPADRRYFSLLFFFVPVAFITLLMLQRFHSRILRFFDLGAVTLWVAFTVGVSVVVFGVLALSSYVSSKISMALAVFAWLILLFLLFGLGYWDFSSR